MNYYGLIALSLVALSGSVFFAILNIASSLKTKSEKVSEKEAHGGEDIISRLPDDVLISIITRISSKEVVRTSILSKRWKNLYKFVSLFYFGCTDFIPSSTRRHHTPHNSKITVSALDKFLCLHSSSKIQFFRLCCCLHEKDAYRLEQCIYSLGRLGIEHLILKCSCHQNMQLSFSFSLHLLSEMPSLKVLQLNNCFLQPNLKSSKCSNSLETITLICVQVLPGALECILSNCSSLKTLEMLNCTFPSKKLYFVGQKNLQLESLRIDNCVGVEEIEIHASNLINFEFTHEIMVEFLFDYVPQLQHFFLDLRHKDVMPYVYGKLAGDLPRLKSLSFTTKGDFYRENFQPMEINTFNNLRRLELILCSSSGDLCSVTPFIHSCPLLEEFYLLSKIDYEYNVANVKMPEVTFHPHLKKAQLSGFRGSEIEIDFALYILKCAVTLEQMCIFRRYTYTHENRFAIDFPLPWSEDIRKMIHEKLQGQAISETAQLTIRHKLSCKSLF